jgi:hypothetical protein
MIECGESITVPFAWKSREQKDSTIAWVDRQSAVILEQSIMLILLRDMIVLPRRANSAGNQSKKALFRLA